MMLRSIACAVAFICLVAVARGFQPKHHSLPQARTSTACFATEGDKPKGIFSAIGNFFEELDAFIEDASARRLGNGAAFYGKRKSNFYGKEDKMRKNDRNTADPTEDYQGPSQSGYFKWMPDEDGQMRPVTRMRNQVIERNPSYWDRVYEEQEK
jgi:hypothetical protein